MTPVASISSCLNCEKVFSLVDELSKNMHGFEVFTLEMEFDIKSAKSKSQEVLSNFWQLISTIKSLTVLSVEGSGKQVCENPNLSSLVVSLEKSQVKMQNLEHENKPADSNSKLKQSRKRRRPQQAKPKKNPNPKPSQTEKRSLELQRAKSFLRTIKCETSEGFYNLFECIKCRRQFNDYYNGLHHIKTMHLNLGTACPTCKQKYFDKESLELHIPKCHRSKQNQPKRIKVFLKDDRKTVVKVHLHPHQKQEQKEKQSRSAGNRNRNQSRNPGKKIKDKSKQVEKKRKVLDLSRLQVRNPYPNFSIVKALNVKVVIQRLKMEKNKEVSIIPQIPTTEISEIQIKTGTGKRTSSSKFESNGNE